MPTRPLPCLSQKKASEALQPTQQTYKENIQKTMDHFAELVRAEEEAAIPATSEDEEQDAPAPHPEGAEAGNHADEASINILDWEKEEEADFDLCNLSKSCREKHRSVRRQEWTQFNNGNPKLKPKLVTTRDGSHPTVNRTLIRDFMEFCASKYQPKKCRFQMCVAFLQYYVKIQHTEFEFIPPKGLVMSDPKVSGLFKAIQGKAADDAMANSEDILADCLYRDVTTGQSIRFVKHCLRPSHGSRLQQVTFMARLNLAAVHRESLMAGQRGELIVHQRLGFCFVEQFENIGPHKNGMPIDMTLTNKGKENKVGRREFTALGCHVNPILDAIGLQGIMLLWRFIGNNEPFPDSDNTKAIKERPLYASPKSHMKNHDKVTLGRHWSKANEDCEILTQKITHQGKGQLLREFDRAQIPSGTACRHGNVSSSNKSGKEITRVVVQSYMTNKPAETIVQAAGGDWHNLRGHSPPWALLSEEDPHGYACLLYNLLANSEYGVPALCKSEVDFEKRRGETRKTHRHFVGARLKNAQGYNDAMRSRLQRGLLLAAARPLDEDGNLVENSVPIYQLFSSSCPVFKLPIFQSDDFLRLVERVRVAQDGGSVSSVAPEPRENESETLVLLRRIDSTNRQIQATNRQIQAENGQLRGSFFSLVMMLHGQQQPVDAFPAFMSTTHQGATNFRFYPVQQATTMPALPVPPNPMQAVEQAQSEFTLRGTKRKRKPATGRLEQTGERSYIQSTSNITAWDYWNEYAHGVQGNGRKALRYLESYDPVWRKDKPGTKERKFAMFWSTRKKLYLYVALLIHLGNTEEQAVEELQKIFDEPGNCHPKKEQHQPILKNVNKALAARIDALQVPRFSLTGGLNGVVPTFTSRSDPADVELSEIDLKLGQLYNSLHN
jgi:hypothetical protein